MTATACSRERPSRSCSVAVGASKRLMRDVSPAERAATKNTAMITVPPGMVSKRFGRKMKRSPGPLWSKVCPAVAMAGMMTTAASSAAMVSNTATVRAARGTSSVLGR